MHFVKHLPTSIMNFNNTISKEGGESFQGGRGHPHPSAPLNETMYVIYSPKERLSVFSLVTQKLYAANLGTKKRT